MYSRCTIPANASAYKKKSSLRAWTGLFTTSTCITCQGGSHTHCSKTVVINTTKKCPRICLMLMIGLDQSTTDQILAQLYKIYYRHHINGSSSCTYQECFRSSSYHCFHSSILPLRHMVDSDMAHWFFIILTVLIILSRSTNLYGSSSFGIRRKNETWRRTKKKNKWELAGLLMVHRATASYR